MNDKIGFVIENCSLCGELYNGYVRNSHKCLSKYTELGIHQAMDLAKAGCEDVELMHYFRDYYQPWATSLAVTLYQLFNAKYRIEISKLNEWNSKEKV